MPDEASQRARDKLSGRRWWFALGVEELARSGDVPDKSIAPHAAASDAYGSLVVRCVVRAHVLSSKASRVGWFREACSPEQRSLWRVYDENRAEERRGCGAGRGRQVAID